MGEKGHVKVFGMWASPMALRVEWALQLKGVEYEYVDEDLANKSEDLLQYNPVTKKVPVLVHDGKPIAESLVIVEYIDEVWNEGYHPIMPEDPYERALARFWAKYAEDKCAPAVFVVYSTAGETQQKALHEAIESLRTLEQALEGKKFFGGETIGYLDIVVGWFAYWFPIFEEIMRVDIINAQTLPLMNAWLQRFLDNAVVKKPLPPRDKIYELNRARREMLLSAQSS